MYKLFYKNYDVIVCQSKDMQRDILSYASVPKEKTIIIPNSIDEKKIHQMVKDSSHQFNKSYFNIVSNTINSKDNHILVIVAQTAKLPIISNTIN